MSKLRVLVIGCDPIDRLEKSFFLMHYCHSENFHYTLSYLNESDPDWKCRSSFADVMKLKSPFSGISFIDEHRFEPSFRLLHHKFGQRMRTVHQEALKSEEGIRRVAAWLGASATNSFTPLMYNSWKGHRTDLCWNKTHLLGPLRRTFKDDYEALATGLLMSDEPLPAVLTKRLTRCDKAEQLESKIRLQSVLAGVAPDSVFK